MFPALPVPILGRLDGYQRTRAGEPIDVVPVSAGPVAARRRASPNYFLDTQALLRMMML